MARTVLFSNKDLAKFINENFEPVWQSVREVPIVNIDFGNGNTVKRTINGNVATFVCNSNGEVLDVLPGLYSSDSYKSRLEQLCLLNKYIEQFSAKNVGNLLGNYHHMQYQRLLAGKTTIELALKNKEDGNSRLVFTDKAPSELKRWQEPISSNESYRTLPFSDSLDEWSQLNDDVRYNETVMRKQIHNRLEHMQKSKEPATVAGLSKWIYREVLHTDIDDPYLGLQTVLDGTYPFEKMNRVRPLGGS